MRLLAKSYHYIKPLSLPSASSPPLPSASLSPPSLPLPLPLPSPPLLLPLPATLPATLLRAVYDYTAQFDEELSFPEGAIIELTKTDDNGVDDGWWQGTYAGKSGVFPSVVVEPISNGVVSIWLLIDVDGKFFVLKIHQLNFCRLYFLEPTDEKLTLKECS